MLLSPAGREGIQYVQRTLWQTWVAAWVGWPAEPGAEVEFPSSEVYGDDSEGRVNGGYIRYERGRATLRMDMEVVGGAATALMAEAMQSMVSAAGVDPATAEVTDARMVTTLEVVTDPLTLRPDSALYELEFSATIGGARSSRVERHEFTFDWAHAEGCGR